MKAQLSTLLAAALGASVASADIQSGPFQFKITGKANSSLDGYAEACHVGAGAHALCYVAGPAAVDAGGFYFNQTTNSSSTGTLIYKSEVNDAGTEELEDSIMGLQYQINSNVAAAVFGNGADGVNAGFDSSQTLYLSTDIDDSTFSPGTPPNTTTVQNLSNWVVCIQSLEGYYDNAVGWAQTLPPHNPTCQGVTITKVTP